MAYDELVARLDGDESVSVAAFPDGSVDTYYRVFDGDDRIGDRETFRRMLAEGRDSVRIERERRVAGGQSVNMARQADALGASVRLAGHLDHAVFDALGLDAVSMGEPSHVRVLRFGDGDLMLAEESNAIDAWDTDRLREAVGDLGDFLDADLVCGANWPVVNTDPGVFDALADAAEQLDRDRVFVFDPGAVGGLSDERRRALLAGLGRLGGGWRTVLSVNPTEAASLAAALDGAEADATADDWLANAEALSVESGIAGVVVHGEDRAVAATADGDVRVPNLDTSRVRTVTGAGDRFSAALGYALASGWGWEVALQAGNGCASSHVVREASASAATLAEFVARHETRA